MKLLFKYLKVLSPLLCVFTVRYICRVLSRLHRRWSMVDNCFVSNANCCCVCGPRTSAYRRSGCRRVISSDRAMPQVLGRSFSLLHLERHSSRYFDGKTIPIIDATKLSGRNHARLMSSLYSLGSEHHNIQEQRLPGTVLLSSHGQRLLGCVGKATRSGDSADTDTHNSGSGCHTDVSIPE